MNLRISCFILILLSLTTSVAISKEKSENRKAVDMNMDPTYIAFPMNFEKGNDNRFDQVFESEINLPLHFFDLPNEKWDWFMSGYMTVIAKINLRMYWEESNPVKTPSFMPRATYFFWFNSLNNLVHNNFKILYFSVMISHHSNGQSGNFYTNDGRVNTESGNFSTNFLEFAANAFTLNNFWINLAYQWHPGFNREPGLHDQYETGRALIKLRKFFFFEYIDLQLFGSVSYITTGRKYIQTPEEPNAQHPAIAGIKAKTSDNFNYQLQFHLRPYWFDDVSFFAKYDYGYDYYNIHFQEKIHKIQVGVSGYVN
jgi:hypothetical protein